MFTPRQVRNWIVLCILAVFIFAAIPIHAQNGEVITEIKQHDNGSEPAPEPDVALLTGESIFSDNFFQFNLQNVIPRFILLVSAPLVVREMLWILFPMVLMLLLMEFYFGRYTGEDLGWNTAVGNSMVLVFVSIDLFRQLYGSSGLGQFQEAGLAGLQQISPYVLPVKTVMAGFVGLVGISLLLTNFFHVLPKKLAFVMSSSLPIDIIAYLAIVIVYTGGAGTGAVPMDLTTIAAAGVLFVVLWLFFALMHLLQYHVQPEMAKSKKTEKKEEKKSDEE